MLWLIISKMPTPLSLMPISTGAEVYRSDDGGATWQKTHTEALTGLYFTYGYYFGQIAAQVDNADVLYILGVPLLKSEDGGASWKDINGNNQHGDHHVLHIHPEMQSYCTMAMMAGSTFLMMEVIPG